MAGRTLPKNGFEIGDAGVPGNNQTPEAVTWSLLLQRRVLRLLIKHHEKLFRGQFRLFFVESSLPQMPLLQQYDRYMKLYALSNELLDDILPRIRRQLSLKTSHARLREEAPTRGDIDWQRTLERSWTQAPGQPPLQFETRLRQRTLDTPENVLTVAILLAFRQELQQVRAGGFVDEDPSRQEQAFLASAHERAERELAAPYARALLNQARNSTNSGLDQEVERHLRPGSSPYRDLLSWWQRFQQFRVGRATGEQAQALASRRSDEKADAWLYELWIMLEFLHLLHAEQCVEPPDLTIAPDHLACTFTWLGGRFRLVYNRQLDTSTSFEAGWEDAPASRPDYSIERTEPLEIRHQNRLIWREPPVILDAKYYLEGSDPAQTHGPIKKLLGDMTLLEAEVGILFFPQLPEPTGNASMTRTIRKSRERYTPQGETTHQVHLYHLEPSMPLSQIQQRLRAVLDLAKQYLPERSQPVCEGAWLDPDTVHAGQRSLPAHTILCPKRHVGPGITDLVNVDSDCLKNSLLCHVMGQPIVPPFVSRVMTQEQLAQRSNDLRTRSDEQLREAEASDNQTSAESIRQHIFTGIGRAVEQYIKLFANTGAIENMFETWIFGERWKIHPYSLNEHTRNSLVSGEYVWQNYQEATLHDWAAPAIQFCRALEHELHRRFGYPTHDQYHLAKSGFTLGTIPYAYNNRSRDKNAAHNWSLLIALVKRSGSSSAEFEALVERINSEQVTVYRNLLAHSGFVNRDIAASLRKSIIGDKHSPGILCWLAEHIEPPANDRHL
jgi:hypothetical protein